MFGKNPILKQVLDPVGTLSVIKVFYTIQGEGPLAGYPAIFIRLAGCNLQCKWCDTEFMEGAKTLTVAEILAEVHAVNTNAACMHVVISGGEPFRQNIVPLVRALDRQSFNVQIETAGTLTLPSFPWDIATIVVSPKTGKVHPDFSTGFREVYWKYIIRSGEVCDMDGLPVVSPQTGAEHRLARPPSSDYHSSGRVFVQACDEHDQEATARNIQLTKDIAMTHGYRYSHQIHKLIGVE